MIIDRLSAEEVRNHVGAVSYSELFEDILIYGGYPELFHISGQSERQEYLIDIIHSALYKDILELDGVRSSGKIRDLLRLLAFQIGSEVSLSELGSSLDMSKNTVARYLDLLEQSFVIMNIRGYSRNLRKEIVKTSRYYFYDNGIRNALIENYNPLILRDDVGQLWENWIVMERVKSQHYHDIHANNFFWRTYDKKEIDWVEERGCMLHGYETVFQLFLKGEKSHENDFFCSSSFVGGQQYAGFWSGARLLCRDAVVCGYGGSKATIHVAGRHTDNCCLYPFGGG